MARVMKFRISEIEVPQGLLPRVITGTVEEKVREYAELMENGVEFDPIKVWEREDGRVWVVDGVHRLQAHKLLGREFIEAESLPIKDELHYRMEAIRHNLKHGLALKPEERKLCAQQLYLAGVDVAEIQKLFGVSDRTVRRWLSDIKKDRKEELIEKAKKLREQGYSIREIAKELEIPFKTVHEWLTANNSQGCAKTDTMSEIAHLTNSHSQQHPPADYDATTSVKDVLDDPERLATEEEREIASAEEDDVPESVRRMDSDPEFKAKVLREIRKVKEQEEKKKEVKLRTKEEIVESIRRQVLSALAEYHVRFCGGLNGEFYVEEMLKFIDEIRDFYASGKWLKDTRYLDWVGLWRMRGMHGFRKI